MAKKAVWFGISMNYGEKWQTFFRVKHPKPWLEKSAHPPPPPPKNPC